MSDTVVLPHDLLAIIGNSIGWNSLISLALTNREWYQHMIQFPWDRVMPYHRSFNINKDFNHMNMFSMLASLRTRTKRLARDGLDTTEIELINGIPVMDTGYKTSTDIMFYYISQVRQFLTSRWKLSDITEQTFLDIKTSTMPEAVRMFLLKDELTITTLRHGWNKIFLKFIPGSLNNNVVQSHLIFPYTGITDFYQEYDDFGKCKTLHLISNTTQYQLDITNKIEVARIELNYDGNKFFGFYKNTIVPVAIQQNSAIMVKTIDGWRQLDPLLISDYGGYISYRGNRLSITKIPRSQNFWRHRFETADIIEKLDDDDNFDPELDMQNSLDNALTIGSAVSGSTKTIQKGLPSSIIEDLGLFEPTGRWCNGPKYPVH